MNGGDPIEAKVPFIYLSYITIRNLSIKVSLFELRFLGMCLKTILISQYNIIVYRGILYIPRYLQGLYSQLHHIHQSPQRMKTTVYGPQKWEACRGHTTGHTEACRGCGQMTMAFTGFKKPSGGNKNTARFRWG